MAAQLMSKAAYARHRGVGKSAVSNWIKRDQIVLKNGKVDVAASDAKLAQTVDPAHGRDRKGGGSKPAAKARQPKRGGSRKRAAPDPEPAEEGSSVAKPTLESERLLEVQERRRGQALKNAQVAGELVPFSAFETRLQALIAGFCERLQAELRAQAEELAIEQDKRAVRGRLDDTVHRVREDFAARIAGGDEDRGAGEEEDE